jgi:Holliday junction DNA helicase RuvA
LEPGELALALTNQDINRLSSIKGIGTKTAERILVELKDKAARLWNLQEGKEGTPMPQASPVAATAVSEAILALQSLGYSKAEAEKALKTVTSKSGHGANIETLIREALKSLGS